MKVGTVVHYLDPRMEIDHIVEASFSDVVSFDEYVQRILGKIAEKYSINVYLVNRSVPTEPPKDWHPDFIENWWCPYCAAEREFIRIEEVRRCEICGVTESEFHVRKHNGLDAAQIRSMVNDNSRRVRQQRKKHAGETAERSAADSDPTVNGTD